MKKFTTLLWVMAACLLTSNIETHAAAIMNNYCNVPPFVAQSVPPLVLLTAGRDHKLYYEAFNDAMDLDEDGRVDIGYRHNIDYYGYYDVYKCYTYNNATGLFSPATVNTDKFCTSGAGQWSGNILNFLTMSRMDVMRKVLYGGHRSTDTTSSTILERVYIPGEAHSWSKEFSGRLCQSGTTYTNLCNNSSDCDSGYTCVDKSQNLIGKNAADNSVCPATAVTWSSTTNGKILVAQFWAQAGGATNGPTHADLLNSYYTDGSGNTVAPLSLIDISATGNPAGTSSKVKYINNFNDSLLNPENSQTNYTNYLAVTQFTTPNNDDSTGLWQFAVDGDDGVEVEILPSNKIPSNPANWIVANYYGAHGACFLPSATSSPNSNAFCSATQSSEGVGYFNLAALPAGKVCAKNTTKSCTTDANCTLSTEGRCVNGGIQMVKNTKYYLIVRQTTGTGQGGVRVWYRRPKDASNAWSIFGSSTLTLSSPTIAPGNECSIRFKQFVDKADTTTGENKRHLFCSTTRSFDGATGVAGPPLLRFLSNRSERMWNWASKERPVCADVIRKVDDSGDTALSVDTAKADAAKIWDYTVRVEVCKSTPGRETNCRPYTDASTGVVTYKPSGLLQKYGEGDGTKVCSRTYSKTCTSDTDCTNNELASPPVREGLCIERAPMYFGLMTDSYVKNLSGGVLRKDIWSLGDEINMSTGQFIKPASSSASDFNTTFPQGSIIQTYESLRTVGFQYSDNSYQDSSSAYNNGGSCGWIVNNPLGEGKCRMWGNPIAEMMYEGLRYLAGKPDPTASFIDATAQDGSLPLYRQDWGVVRGSTKYRPYGDKDNKSGIFPICSKPFMLVLSDENVSYDSDSLPGSKFNTSFVEDSGLPKLNINVGTLLDTIGDTVANGGEGINGSSVFIGETTTSSNFMCTPKTATGFSLIRGLCPEEPTKQGSYYAAAVAYYGKTALKTNTEQKDGAGNVIVQGKPNATTFALVMGSPVPKMMINAGGKIVTLVPVGKSFSGGGVENSCSSKCTSSSINAAGSLVISGCSTSATASSSGSFCPSNQIVDFYVDTVLYDNNNAPPYSVSNPAPSITYAKFRINFEDVEQGADHDMDAIATYEICTGNTCSPAIAPGEVNVTVTSDYSAGGIDQVMGFIISGTTEDDTYLVVKDDGVAAGTSVIGALPLSWEKTFTVSSSGSTAKLLKSPLWYAAKWGAFKDSNSNSKPDLAGEWDNDGDGVPDNYYLVVNPLKLEQQLDKALTDILAQTSSGTAASIVNKRQESGANLLTAVFFPEREFKENSSSAGVKVKWVGDLQNFWYYFDPFFANSGLVEDSISDNTLNLLQDHKVDLVFNSESSQTTATLYNFDGKTYTLAQTNVNVNDLKALWRAGDSLFARTTSRTVYTNLPPPSRATNNYTASFYNFADASKATLAPYLQSPDATDASKIIAYTLGTDASGYRNRTITYSGITNTWKLGDIISSTPKIQSSIPVNNYYNSYSDTSYDSFVKTASYKARNAVYVGANDGMLHAFSLGKITAKNKAYEKAAIAADGANPLGSELWAYIPSNALPYLRYLADPNYEHIFTVDLTSTLVDASIIGATSNPENEIRNINSWRTLLIGGMGLGGASRLVDGTCASTTTVGSSNYADCVKTPINSAGIKDVGLSSYFALDVTTPTTPSLMWEFSRADLGFALLEPAIVKMNGVTTIPDTKNSDTNGKWFAIFVSGPTGPINTLTHQFYGRSDQGLKVFVVEMATGKLVKTFDVTSTDTKIAVVNDLKNAKAFGSSLSTNAIDLDEGKNKSPSYYSTDVVYIGYTRQKKNSSGVFSWDYGSDGGMLRLLMNNSVNPDDWTLTSLIDNTGPITASIGRLYDDNDPGALPVDRPAHALWLYFGSGRYFYKDQNIDASDEKQYLFGLKEPCYKASADKSYNEIDNTCALNISTSCATKNCFGLLKLYRDGTDVIANNTSNNLYDSTLIEFLTNKEYEDKYYNEQTVLAANLKKGWFAKLDSSSGDFKAERMITTPLVRTSGATLFTTFKPTADICSYGGKTLLNLRDYRTGGMPVKGSMKGSVIIQLSTGAISKVDLSTLVDNRVIGAKPPVLDLGMGKPPTQAPQDEKPHKPIRKILHIQEK